MVAVLGFLPWAISHSRLVCPPPRSPDTGIKNGACGAQNNDFSGAITTIAPGPFTVVFEESVAHTGAPWRISLSADADDAAACILLDHIPHDDASSPTYMADETYHRFQVTVDIPDVDCERCSLHLSNPMTDKIGGAGGPTGIGCTEPGSCFSVYYSCSTPLRITGSVPRGQHACAAAPPAGWPQNWTSPDTGGLVAATTPQLYRRESATWVDGWLMDAPPRFRDASAGYCVAPPPTLAPPPSPLPPSPPPIPPSPPPSPPTALPACSSNRPGGGWATHRTLALPTAMVHAASQAQATAWATALCCVYTWLEASSSLAAPRLTTYDGGHIHYEGAASLEAVAQAALDDVCGMGMGATDCSSGAECIATAFPPPLPPSPPRSLSPPPPPSPPAGNPVVEAATKDGATLPATGAPPLVPPGRDLLPPPAPPHVPPADEMLVLVLVATASAVAAVLVALGVLRLVLRRYWAARHGAMRTAPGVKMQPTATATDPAELSSAIPAVPTTPSVLSTL